MRDVIDELLSRNDVSQTYPASRTDINAASRQFDGPLPESLVKLWRVSDGVTFDSLNANILGSVEILRLLADDVWDQQLAERGLVPVLDDHESNYLMVSVHDPLASRVLHLPHDEGSRLLYRDFESCVRGLLDCADRGADACLFLFETQGDYPPDAPRPEEDQDAAKALLAGRHERDEWNHAAQLLDASNLDEWARLLETDHFVRRDVRARMEKMTSPAIRELLRKDERDFEEFAATMAEFVRDAGLSVGERSGHCLRVGRAWYELESFFHRRNIPNAVPRIIEWIRDQMAGRNPYDRRGNFMTD